MLAALVLLGFLAIACSAIDGDKKFQEQEAYPVEPIFRDFYNRLGGEEILGPAISPIRMEGSQQSQYTNAALMVYDTEAGENNRFWLASLGLAMGIQEKPVEKSQRTNGYYVNGHLILGDFVPLFEKLGGVGTVGKPLSEVHFNPEMQRYEQYFENLGFYRLEGEPENSAHLLAYGAWSCDVNCRSAPPPNSIIVIQNLMEQPFLQAVEKLGSDFAGLPLSPAYIASDGLKEQIFENVVLVVDPDFPERVRMRPIGDMLGARDNKYESQTNDPSMFFFKVEGAKGFNVLTEFFDYLNNHGGSAQAGNPISRVDHIAKNIRRQCFNNLCLEINWDGYIHPTPLGYSYRELFYHFSRPTPTPTQISSQQVSLNVEVKYPSIAPDQSQEIRVSLKRNGKPLPNVTPALFLTLPDGTQLSDLMPPTGEDGRTSMIVNPIPAPSGTLITYQVCLNSESKESYCFQNSYVIWKSR